MESLCPQVLLFTIFFVNIAQEELSVRNVFVPYSLNIADLFFLSFFFKKPHGKSA